MKLQVVKKRASSLRELGRETVELPQTHTLRELLTELTKYELKKQSESQEQAVQPVLEEENIRNQSKLGRVSFGVSYNERKTDSDEIAQEAVRVMFQDFEDGLFRVFLNGTECMELDEEISTKDGDEAVFIRLVMLSGRMW